ncbi:XRE family transcriptional regulator [Nocardia sp. NPDC051570]|uniref:XRE family transcriptional regulator n=1 Tax=Nocardia sp. NPDC051570 TaxID=3364324 RepID=UPI00378A2A36
MDKSRGELATLAGRLNYLFDTVHPPNRGPYSNDEVADAISQQGGATISATYLWLLRKGQRDNPTMKHVEALAEFFGVPPAYFFGDNNTVMRVAGDLHLLHALKDIGAQQVALRANGMSPSSISSILEVMERVRELEGLPSKLLSDDPE